MHPLITTQPEQIYDDDDGDDDDDGGGGDGDDDGDGDGDCDGDDRCLFWQILRYQGFEIFWVAHAQFSVFLPQRPSEISEIQCSPDANSYD